MKNKPLILAALVLAMLVPVGCKKSEPSNEYPPAGDNNSLSVTQQLENAKEVATNAWQKAKETTTNALESVKEGTTNAWASVKESVQTAADYTYEKKDDFVAKAQADMDALDLKIKELSDKVATASDSVKADAKIKLDTLRDKRAALSKKLDEVKNSAEANWADVKTGFKQSYEDAKQSLKEAWDWLRDKMS